MNKGSVLNFSSSGVGPTPTTKGNIFESWIPKVAFVVVTFFAQWWASSGDLSLINQRTLTATASLLILAVVCKKFARKNALLFPKSFDQKFLNSEKIKRSLFALSLLGVYLVLLGIYFKIFPLPVWDSDSHFVRRFYQEIRFVNVALIFGLALPALAVVLNTLFVESWGNFQSSFLLAFPFSFSLQTPEFFLPIFFGLVLTQFIAKKTTLAWAALFFSLLIFCSLFLLRLISWA